RIQFDKLLRDVVAKLMQRAYAHGIVLREEIGAGPKWAFGDPDLLERAVHNLVDNAIVHTPPGTEVVVSLVSMGNTVRGAISDNGPGIPEADIPYLFDRLFRAPRKDPEAWSQGAGLGLAIVRRILWLHGSACVVRSEIGRGTQFAFNLSTGSVPLPAFVE